jgi:uncharacterized damage-inducible protein DinB
LTELQAALIRQLAATHQGDPWYGSSWASLLTGLTPDQAAAHSIPGAHSIWEILLHVTAWTNEVRKRLAGQQAAHPAEGDWPAVGAVSPATWEEARRALAEAHAQLLAAVTALPEGRWADRIGRSRDAALGTGVSFGGMLVGLAQHDAYHAGQVALLRRALGLR